MRTRQLLLVFIAASGAILTLRFGLLWYLKPGQIVPIDWNVYWIAVERLLSGQPFYGVHEIKPFKYSPTFLYAFRASFFLLEKHLSVALWTALSVLTYFVAYANFCDRVMRGIEGDPRASLRFALGAAAAVLLSWHGFVEELSYGQTELFIGAGLLLFMTERPGPWARALIWAFFFSMKPHLVLILFLSSLSERTLQKTVFEIGRAFALTVIVYALPALWIGPGDALRLLGAWTSSVQGQHDLSLFLWNTNQSLPAALARDFGAPEIFFPLTILGIAASILWAYVKRPLDRVQALGFGIIIYLAFAPLSWRWFIALWPLTVVSILARNPSHWKSLIPWGVLALIGIAPFSSLFHLHEADRLSELGIPAWASFALALASAFAQKARPSRLNFATEGARK